MAHYIVTGMTFCIVGYLTTPSLRGYWRRSVTVYSPHRRTDAGSQRSAFFGGHPSKLYGMTLRNFSRLQRIQNSLARLVCKAPYRCSPQPLLKSLHWLPVTECNEMGMGKMRVTYMQTVDDKFVATKKASGPTRGWILRHLLPTSASHNFCHFAAAYELIIELKSE
jgi:hypothetical protein